MGTTEFECLMGLREMGFPLLTDYNHSELAESSCKTRAFYSAASNLPLHFLSQVRHCIQSIYAAFGSY